MASVHRNPGSPYWTASIKAWVALEGHPQGGYWKRTRRSTRVPVSMPKDRAALVAGELEAQESVGARDTSDPARFFKRSVARLMLAAGMEPPALSTPWDSWSQRWVETRRGVPATIERYRLQIARLSEYLGARKSADISTLTLADIQGWYAAMKASGFSDGTSDQAVRTVRGCLSDAVKSGLLERNPAALMKFDPVKRHARQPFTPAQIRKLLAHIKTRESAEWRVAVLFGLFYGLRLRDAIGRDHSEIKRAGNLRVLSFVPMKKRKRGTRVSLPLVGELAKLKGSGPITPGLAATSESGNPSMVFARILRSAGIEVTRSKGVGLGHCQSDLTFHSLRHTCASWLADQGVESSVRRLISDHDSEAVHAKYTHPAIETMKGAVEKVAGMLSKKD